jgi:hypothetical protein
MPINLLHRLPRKEAFMVVPHSLPAFMVVPRLYLTTPNPSKFLVLNINPRVTT